MVTYRVLTLLEGRWVLMGTGLPSWAALSLCERLEVEGHKVKLDID